MAVYIEKKDCPTDCRSCKYAKLIDCVEWIGYFEEGPPPTCPIKSVDVIIEDLIKRIKYSSMYNEPCPKWVYRLLENYV